MPRIQQDGEHSLGNLLRESLAGVGMLKNGVAFYQNPEFEKFFGPGLDANKSSYFIRLHPEDQERVKTGFQKLIAGACKNLDLNFRARPRNGGGSDARMRWVQCRANRIRYGGDEVILVNMMDITTARELQQLVALEDRMGILGRLATGIAHEIRNPLSLINVHLANIEKLCCGEGKEGPPEVRRCLCEMVDASNKIRDVVKRVLDFSDPRIPQLGPMDINQCVLDAVELCTETLKRREITLETGLDPSLPLCLADSQSVGQILLNLITNASEAMDGWTGERAILVRTWQEAQGIVFGVSDTGPGVPQQILERIFDPFFTTKDKRSGTGLSMVRRLVNDHKAELVAYPRQGGGMEFRVILKAISEG